MQPPISDNFPFLAEHIHGVRPILRSYLARAEQYHDDGDHAELEEEADDDHRELEDAHAADAESPMATTSSTVSRSPELANDPAKLPPPSRVSSYRKPPSRRPRLHRRPTVSADVPLPMPKCCQRELRPPMTPP